MATSSHDVTVGYLSVGDDVEELTLQLEEDEEDDEDCIIIEDEPEHPGTSGQERYDVTESHDQDAMESHDQDTMESHDKDPMGSHDQDDDDGEGDFTQLRERDQTDESRDRAEAVAAEMERRAEPRYDAVTFHCDPCDRTFANQQKMETHNKRVHRGLKRNVCDVCLKSFSLKPCYVKHIRECYVQLTCVWCKRKYERHDQLSLHEQRCPARAVTCDLCRARFINRKCMLAHRESHVGEEPFTCGTCEKKFAYADLLWKHELEHARERKREEKRLLAENKVFSCYICGMNLKTKHKLQVHLNKHKRSVIYSQTYGKKWTLKNNPERPLSAHASTAMARRAVADKFFRQNPEIHASMYLKVQKPKSHVNPKFKCSLCSEKFYSKEDRIQHIRFEHLDKNNEITYRADYTCGECGAEFHMQCSLESHIKHYHQTQNDPDNPQGQADAESEHSPGSYSKNKVGVWTCSICGKSHNRKWNMKRHMMTHFQGETRQFLQAKLFKPGEAKEESWLDQLIEEEEQEGGDQGDTTGNHGNGGGNHGDNTASHAAAAAAGRHSDTGGNRGNATVAKLGHNASKRDSITVSNYGNSPKVTYINITKVS